MNPLESPIVQAVISDLGTQLAQQFVNAAVARADAAAARAEAAELRAVIAAIPTEVPDGD